MYLHRDLAFIVIEINVKYFISLNSVISADVPHQITLIRSKINVDIWCINYLFIYLLTKLVKIIDIFFMAIAQLVTHKLR